MSGATSYLIKAYGASDLSGGVLASAKTTNTSLSLSALSLAKGTYWLTVTASNGAQTVVWRDGGFRYGIGYAFTDLTGWATPVSWVYARDNALPTGGAGVVTGISPPTGWVVVASGSGWTTGRYPISGYATAYSTVDGNQNMLNIAPTTGITTERNGGGVGFWQPYVAPTKQVVFDGNSLMQGYAGEDPAITALTTAGYKWVNGGNFGVPSQTTTDMIADAATQIDVLYDASKVVNVVVAWEITNELHAGVSVATALANFKTYCQGRKTAGFKVAAVTVLPRMDGGGNFTEAKRIACNAELLNAANLGVYWDAVVNTTADARLEDQTNTTYFNSDQIHLTIAGYRIVGTLMGTVFDQL